MKKLENKTFLLGAGIILIAATLSGCAQGKKEPGTPITVRAQVDKTTLAIGDKLKYTILIEKDKDIQIEPFAFGRDVGNFAIKDFGSKRSSFFNKEKISQWYILDTYVTGKATIPKVTVKYKRKKDKDWSSIEAGEVSVEVKSLLEKSGNNIQLRDVKGPVGLPSVIKRYLLLVGLLLLAALGLSAGYSLKKNKEEKILPKRPAHEIAYEQLEALRSKDYIGHGLIKEYYTEVSDIIRHYLEDRFSLKAPEMTTEEFLASAKESGELAGEHKNLLKEFLLCCDLVKFAKYAPSVDEIDSIFDSAKNFIDQTKENEPA
ncbi:MAG: hypothetical protein PHT50_05930 [Candidatus Omnitrophica bacterium]|nr:hypothetical protein [Candidatus Omnitrophota bacterium]